MLYRLNKISINILFLTGIFLFVILASCEQKNDQEIDAFDEWTDTIVKLRYDNGTSRLILGYKPGDTLMHYEWNYFVNGNLWIEGSSYDTLRHGKWKAYNEAGLLISMGNYEMGERNGKKIVWHENGQKYFEGMESKGDRVGMWYFYDKDGILAKEIDYSK